ncbi:ShlB/FhaC/HecB family hemolysin secretion/activation protein [Erythrobacter sp. HI0063]|uniref:ShlB/FhaC/HecB family hemolysin secretion/activation protein n=1 Tax=Erythrobacter sp. HI0063 TaxID=1822240 RepID=UPI000AA37176|nr:ShlB/FhaC/HecB family hemolysin secretion/activation protein [Erythrobacter sp. HI0063]
MRSNAAKVLSLVALAGAFPAAAQDALDRTDPTQAEADEKAQPIGDDETRIDTVEIDVDRTVFDDTRYDVGAIVVEGLVALSPQDFADIVQDYSARTLGAGEMSALSDRIAARARERGFIFANAVISPQSLSSGVLRVSLDEGVIDEIRIEGDADPAILSQLEPLRDGRPVTLARLERHILLADDISGIRLRSPRYEREGERGVLIVEARRDRFSGRAELANDGSQPIGPLRARIDFDANGLISPFDEIDFTYSTVPTEPGELQYLAGRYSVVVSPQGTEVSFGASYSATHPGAYLADRDIFGKSARVSGRLRHPLRRSRGFSIWVDGELEFRDLRQDRFGALARHDRIPVARLGFYSRALMLDGAIRGGLTLSQGLDILDATQQGDPLASREDASPDFTVLSGWFAWERALASSLELALAGRGQLSSTPLLITEDIGLGGNSFLRGYDFSERSGDNGIMGSAELRYDWRNPLGMLRRAELYAFADGGVVGNLEDGRGSGSLASSGGGIRTDLTRNLDLDLELAFPLTGPRYDTDDKSPRFNVAVTQSF